jgi:hypothetical protein
MRTIALLLTLLVASSPATSQSIYWLTDYESFHSSISSFDTVNQQISVAVDTREWDFDPIGINSFHIDITNNYVYWLDNGRWIDANTRIFGSVSIARLNGDSISVLHGGLTIGLGGPTDIDLDYDSNTLYWGDFTDSPISALSSSDLDNYAPGSWARLPMSDPFAIHSIAIDRKNGRLYWSNLDFYLPTPGIYSAPLDGTTDDRLIAEGDVHDIAVDHLDDGLYWVERESSTIMRADLDGANPEAVLTSDAVVSFLALDRDAQEVYWSETETGRIRKANYDGTEIEDVITGVEGVARIELDFGTGYEVSAEPEPVPTDRARLRKAYPNPTTGQIRIEFDLPTPSRSTLTLHDGLGRLVDRVDARAYPTGAHTADWDLSRHPAGLYLLVLEADGVTDRLPITLVR